MSNVPPPPPPDPGTPDQPGPPPGAYPPPPPSPPPPPTSSYPPPPPGGSQSMGGGYQAAPSGWSGPPLADWGQRVLAALIDYVAPGIIVGILSRFSLALSLIGNVLVIGWAIYINIQQGETGQTPGKRVIGTKLVRLSDGQPVGAGVAIGRYFLPIVGIITCGVANIIDLLFPLWDAKRQRLVDKVFGTVVITVPKQSFSITPPGQ